MSADDLKELQEELKWVRIREERENSFFEKLTSKGILGFLVPAGCLVTTGILFTGIYQMTQRNKRMQQLMMRYRVAAQGATVLLAMISILIIPFSESKSK